MTAVLLDGVYKGFGSEQVISNLSLRIETGESLVLLGPSGSGKTTALRLVAGLETPDRGHVLIDGRDQAGVAPNERDASMFFADTRVYPRMSARRNLEFPLTVRGTPEPERTRRVEAEAGALGISKLLERMPTQMSAGEQQLVQLAKAMVRAPSLFLIDEPLHALDARARARLRGELRTIQRGYGVTALYATHDQDDAMVLGDRLAILDGGRIRQVGAPAEVYQRPADTFVATFVGSPPMNLVPGHVRDGALWCGTSPLPGAGLRDGPVTIGVRAGDWSIGDTGLQARVARHSFAGEVSEIAAETSFGTVTLLTDPGTVSVGDSVRLRPGHHHVFDSAGEALRHPSDRQR